MPEFFTKKIGVNASASELYSIWADFENFPHFMHNIKSVQKTGRMTSHWVMEGPMGKNFEWDAKTTEMSEARRIAWQSIGGDIETSGWVSFNEIAENQTEVTVSMSYEHPTGAIGRAIAKIFDDPEQDLEEDLQNFKHYAESMLAHRRM